MTSNPTEAPALSVEQQIDAVVEKVTGRIRELLDWPIVMVEAGLAAIVVDLRTDLEAVIRRVRDVPARERVEKLWNTSNTDYGFGYNCGLSDALRLEGIPLPAAPGELSVRNVPAEALRDRLARALYEFACTDARIPATEWSWANQEFYMKRADALLALPYGIAKVADELESRALAAEST